MKRYDDQDDDAAQSQRPKPGGSPRPEEEPIEPADNPQEPPANPGEPQGPGR
jgi:hypothetical protein